MTKFLSLDWFKSKANSAVEKFVEKRMNCLLEHDDNVSTPVEKPYLSIKMVNDVITIVLNDGAVFSKPNSTIDDFYAVRDAKTEYEILTIVGCAQLYHDKNQKLAEIKRINAVCKGIEVLKKYDEFVVEENSVYFKDISRSLPQIMVEELIELVMDVEETGQILADNEKYQSLNRFFMWCCLNPRVEVANELYRFLKDNSFRITKQGFFVALRNVVTLHGSPELVHHISNCYNKVKAVWRKDPADFFIYLNNGQYTLSEKKVCSECGGEGEFYQDWDDDDNDNYEECEECCGTGYQFDSNCMGTQIGNLKDLYLDLPNRLENRFTDDWTKTFDIRIGKVVNMPLKDCNWSTQDCAAAGLHFTADQIHYVGCGDQSVLVLINPMKVVGIGAHKGRCYEYLPIMTVPREEATKILHDVAFDTLELDEDYAIRELDGLLQKAQEGFAIEAEKYKFEQVSDISVREISKIAISLSQMKAQLTKRVSIIK
jgi:hypothetical protein